MATAELSKGGHLEVDPELADIIDAYEAARTAEPFEQGNFTAASEQLFSALLAKFEAHPSDHPAVRAERERYGIAAGHVFPRHETGALKGAVRYGDALYAPCYEARSLSGPHSPPVRTVVRIAACDIIDVSR